MDLVVGGVYGNRVIKVTRKEEEEGKGMGPQGVVKVVAGEEG